MKSFALSSVVLALSFSSAQAMAMKPIVYSPPDGVTIYPSYYSHRGTWTVRISTASPSKGIVRVRGEGAVLAEGDSVLAVIPNRDIGWTLTWKRINEGPVRIMTSLHVEGNDPNSYDEYSQLVLARFRHLRDDVDTVLIQDFRTVQAIAVRDGMRFRCDGDFLVALGKGESEQIPVYRRRAEVKSQTDVHCSDCHLSEATEVKAVTTVGTNGKVTWVRPYEEGRVHGYPYAPKVDPLMWAAVERAVQTFQYQAARTADGPISDCVVLTVRVVP